MTDKTHHRAQQGRFRSPRPHLAGFAYLLLLAGVVGADAWLMRGRFLPLLTETRIEYIFLSAPPGRLALYGTTAFGALLVLHVACSRFLFRTAPFRRGLSATEVRYFWPLWILSLPVLSLGNLVPRFYGGMFAWSYLAVDLRGWLAALVAALFVWQLDERSGGRLRAPLVWARERMAADTRLFLLEASIVAIAMVFATTSSTYLRFASNVHGDEPKYLRYCENLYQGNGFEITDLKPITALPMDYEPDLLRNVKHVASTVPAELRNMVADLRVFCEAGFSHRFNRARYLEAWFVQGKQGGIYQVHNPGVSLLLFPAYYLDRHYLSWRHPAGNSIEHEQFPADKPATNTFFLLMVAIFGAVVFRFLCQWTGRQRLAWLLALAAVMTLPVSAFAFQMYPEVPAGVFVFVVCHYIMFARKDHVAPAAFFGLLTGYLPWFHVRFLLMSTVPVAWMVVDWRRRPGLVVSFCAGYGLMLATLALHTYHITGSVLPSALYYTAGSVEALEGPVGAGLLGIVFDRQYGLLPHSPIYLLSLLGVRDLVRHRPVAAVWIGLLVMLLAIPSISHSWTAAGATPLRYLVAVIPLAMLPLGEALVRWGGSRVFRVVFTLLLTVSVHNAYAYNQHHLKDVGPMVDWSFSGWKINLLFPSVGENWADWNRNLALLMVWFAVCLVLVAAPVLVSRRKGLRPSAVARPAFEGTSYGPIVVITLLVFGLVGSAVPAFYKQRFEVDYLIPAEEARPALQQYLRDKGCTICFSSRRGKLDRRALETWIAS